MGSTYELRVIKSAWGIRVSLTARVERPAAMPAATVTPARPVTVVVAEGLALDLSAVPWLPDGGRNALATGLRLAASRIAAKAEGEPLTVVVEAIAYAETDFQEDGLALAVLRWAEREFGLPETEVGTAFDRGGNRYVFGWGGATGEGDADPPR